MDVFTILTPLYSKVAYGQRSDSVLILDLTVQKHWISYESVRLTLRIFLIFKI